MYSSITGRIASAIIAFGVLSAPAFAGELRYAHVGSEGDIQTRYATEAAAGIEEATGGDIKVQVFPASQLGGVAEMVDGVRLGSISMGHHDFASLRASCLTWRCSMRRSSIVTPSRRLRPQIRIPRRRCRELMKS